MWEDYKNHPMGPQDYDSDCDEDDEDDIDGDVVDDDFLDKWPD